MIKPITKREIESNFPKKLPDDVIEVINNHLSEYWGGDTVYVDYLSLHSKLKATRLSTMTRVKIVELIKDAYSDWTVGYIEDQRDGEYVTFS